MVRDAYSDEMEARLEALGDYLDTFTFPPPSTQEAERQQQETRRDVADLKRKIEAALAKVIELRESPNASQDAAREEIDRRWDEIVRMKDSFA